VTAAVRTKGLSYVPYLSATQVPDYPPSLTERFPSADLVAASAALLARDPRRPRDPGIRFHLDVAPGVLTFRQSRLPTHAHDFTERSAVTAWSQRSRTRMIRTLGTLDYSPLLAAGTPAMTTLTLPGDWLAVAPTGPAFKRLFVLWIKRYERAWGPLPMVWKLEFQRRGAPHLHLFNVPPGGVRRCRCRVCGRPGALLAFREWLSHSWAAVVDHPDPEQYRLGVLAGTGIDFAAGLRASDPKRLSVYFAKHGGAGGSKEYQHEVPAEWLGDGDGPGRFWGFRHLAPVVATAEIPPADWYAMRRTVRRWSQRESYYRQGSKWPSKVELRTRVVRSRPPLLDLVTGEVTTKRKRPVNRRHRYMAGAGGGFVMPNNAPALLSKIARLQKENPL
jgi:hypothetical protein